MNAAGIERVVAYALVTTWAGQLRDGCLTTHGLHDIRRRIRSGEAVACPQDRELLFLVVAELKKRHQITSWHDPSDEEIAVAPDTPEQLLGLIDWGHA